MYGKYLKNLLVTFSLLININLFSQNIDKITVNGYTILNYNKDVGLGLRSKAIGDMYYKAKNYTKAIPYYEKAIKYIPNEADLYFNLGNIYASHKVYNISVKYYKIASEKYILPENHGKTQKNYYLSLMRYAYSLEKLKDYDDNHKKAQNVLAQINQNYSEISEKFPEIIPELESLFKFIYGTTFIISKN
ncbi:MAG: tetratricopeptide repeat protein [Brevinematales bacterium]|nr:tetratricopeptide repeat protein [Brevinematales bacterium]